MLIGYMLLRLLLRLWDSPLYLMCRDVCCGWSIGTKPTFSEKTGLNERVVEAYCITEEWIDLYDHKVRVEFVGFLRPQVKFDGPDQLVDELKRNVEETKRLTA